MMTNIAQVGVAERLKLDWILGRHKSKPLAFARLLIY